MESSATSVSGLEHAALPGEIAGMGELDRDEC